MFSGRPRPFGGVISFIYADLIVVPILLIYRNYYRTKITR